MSTSSSTTGSAASASGTRRTIQETLATLRRRIGRLIGIGFQETATSGTVSTVVMPRAFLYPDQFYTGWQMYVVSGTGSGQTRLIADHDKDTGTLTPAADWDTVPDSTSVIELWKEGTTVDDVNDAINLAILDGQRSFLVPLRAQPSAISSDGLQVSVPADFAYVTTFFQQQAVANQWDQYKLVQSPAFLDEYPTACALKGPYLYVLPKLSDASIADASLCSIHGYRYPVRLVNDADLCEVPAEYVIFMAAYELMADHAEDQARVASWLTKAERSRDLNMQYVEPDSQEVNA